MDGNYDREEAAAPTKRKGAASAAGKRKRVKKVYSDFEVPDTIEPAEEEEEKPRSKGGKKSKDEDDDAWDEKASDVSSDASSSSGSEAAPPERPEKAISYSSSLPRQLSAPQQARWTKVEKEALREVVSQQTALGDTAPQWREIAEQMPGRTPEQCWAQWNEVLAADLVKGTGSWTSADDHRVRELVHSYGRNWTAISEHIPGRTSKQIRERYLNHLDPQLKKTAWSVEEERIFWDAHSIHQNQWSVIARLLPGRTDNDVKNHYYASVRRKNREAGKTSSDEQSLPVPMLPMHYGLPPMPAASPRGRGRPPAGGGGGASPIDDAVSARASSLAANWQLSGGMVPPPQQAWPHLCGAQASSSLPQHQGMPWTLPSALLAEMGGAAQSAGVGAGMNRWNDVGGLQQRQQQLQQQQRQTSPMPQIPSPPPIAGMQWPGQLVMGQPQQQQQQGRRDAPPTHWAAGGGTGSGGGGGGGWADSGSPLPGVGGADFDGIASYGGGGSAAGAGSINSLGLSSMGIGSMPLGASYVDGNQMASIGGGNGGAGGGGAYGGGYAMPQAPVGVSSLQQMQYAQFINSGSAGADHGMGMKSPNGYGDEGGAGSGGVSGV